MLLCSWGDLSSVMTRDRVALRALVVLLGVFATCVAGAPGQESMPPIHAPAVGTTVAVPSSAIAVPQPSQSLMFHNYLYDAFGPYPLSTAMLKAGLDQATNAPPEWRQGMRGYTRRFGSEYGINAVSTTVHYALAETLREDTMYYRCQCTGFFPRVGHALVSTLTARHLGSRRAVFSISALAAPYAGTMTAVYGWYPRRYGAMDAFRMGSYNLLSDAGSNVVLEFRPVQLHSWMRRWHFDNRHGASGSGLDR